MLAARSSECPRPRYRMFLYVQFSFQKDPDTRLRLLFLLPHQPVSDGNDSAFLMGVVSYLFVLCSLMFINIRDVGKMCEFAMGILLILPVMLQLLLCA